ncbi:MAG: PilT/PilU family type 4a pilus ATPase [Deferribacteraceae bacterium]|jgi:twitching motility protein PilT|nr:PilT/PilU family type 4a pilus ATPase [Deferribacteraceae bacterium]
MILDEILTEAVKNGASDIHIQVGAHPRQRVNGELAPMIGFPILTLDMMKSFIDIIPGIRKNEFLASGDADFAYAVQNVSRFRSNAYMQRNTPGFVFRPIPRLDFTVESMGLPQVIKNIATYKRGLVLVTGVTGSGKSTTMAAILDLINQNESASIITLEDPIEFLHNTKKAMVGQREIGVDTPSFYEGLRRALRQDPDVIFIGEMRDLETVETALNAAETGHLVFSTLHTLDAVETINRTISMFPPYQQQQIRYQLSAVLQAVVSQRLIPKTGGRGRVPAVEVLINTAAIRDCIVDPERTVLIEDYIRQGVTVYQMQTFDQSIYSLCTSGLVDVEEAIKWVKRKDDFGLLLKGVSNNPSRW